MTTPLHATSTRAIVRLPSPLIADGQVTHINRTPMNTALAFEQHRAYTALLERHGYALTWAPSLDDHPDGVFVEDALVVIDGTALLTRPGAPSRQGEVDSLVDVVSHLGLPATRVEAPGTIDGGDVLVTDRHVFVGRSTRTNDAGISQLAAFAARTGRHTIAVTVTGCLHLKSAITRLPDGTLLGVPGWLDRRAFTDVGYLVRDASEPSGGDALCLGNVVVLPADALGTVAYLRRQGLVVETVDVSELQKIEAGMTCMSVLL
jgi:dimethylargininase